MTWMLLCVPCLLGHTAVNPIQQWGSLDSQLPAQVQKLLFQNQNYRRVEQKPFQWNISAKSPPPSHSTPRAHTRPQGTAVPGHLTFATHHSLLSILVESHVLFGSCAGFHPMAVASPSPLHFRD